jgi:hypothetical protein
MLSRRAGTERRRCHQYWTLYIEATTSGLRLMAKDGAFGHALNGQTSLSIVGIALS